MMRRFFLPKTETRLYPWPQHQLGGSRSTYLWLDADLLSVSTLQAKAQDGTPSTIASTDYFTEPANSDRFDRIEIDRSSSAAFESGDTPQRSISVAGVFGYGQDTRAAGTVASGLASSSSATEFVCSDGSKIDVGHTILIDSERIFVTEKESAANGSILMDGAITAAKSDNSLTIDTGHGLVVGEVVLLDSEQILVESVTGATTIGVLRAYNGSTLAAHVDDTPVHVYRTLTIERGANGSTAATHANAAAITRYEPDFEIVQLNLAEAIAILGSQSSGWSGTTGRGEGAREREEGGLIGFRKQVRARLQRVRIAAI